MKTKELIRKTVRRIKLEKFTGYLFAKLHAIGSKSEGPLYYLQLWTGKGIPVLKKTSSWENDPLLHACLGQKVVVYGKVQNFGANADVKAGIAYTKICNADEPLVLNLKTSLKNDTLWINKMPPDTPTVFPPERKKITLGFSIQWPYRSGLKGEKNIWKGECPTSRLYDFWMDDPNGRTIWQWSKCQIFRNEVTEVQVSGGLPKVIKVPWFYFGDDITMEGMHVIRARFIASGQEIRKPFWIRFMY